MGELDTRRRLLALIRKYPGLHVREAARQLDTSAALVEYHVAALLESGLVEEERDDRYQRLYAVEAGREWTREERRLLALLRQPTPVRVVLVLLEKGEARHGDLVEALGVGKSTLSFHLKKMERAFLVEKTRDGAYRVVDPKRTEALLLENEPTPTMRDDFAQLWGAFYDA